MDLAEVVQAVQLFHVEHRPVLADQQSVQGALSADAEATLHVSFHAQLAGHTVLTAQPVEGDEHRFGAAGVDGWVVGQLVGWVVS